MADPSARGSSGSNGGDGYLQRPTPPREFQPFISVSDPVLVASPGATPPAPYGSRRISAGSGLPPPPPQVLRGTSGSGLSRNQTGPGSVRQTSTGSNGPFPNSTSTTSPLLTMGNRPGALDSNIMRAWSGGGANAPGGNGVLVGPLVGSLLSASGDSVGGGLGSSTADPRFLSPQMSNHPLQSSASSGVSLATNGAGPPAGGRPRHRKTQSYNGSPTGSPLTGAFLPAPLLQSSQSISSRGSAKGPVSTRPSMSSRTSSVDGAGMPVSPSTSVADFDYRASSSSLVASAVVGPDPENAEGVSSIIHDAARIANWDLVKSMCEKEPLSAQYRGHQGWTALHHACSRRCPFPEVVEALLGAYPGALLDLNLLGWTPLHYAARSKAPPGVVKILLHAFPDIGLSAAAKRCPAGRSPLYYALRYEASDEVVDMLLEADPGAALDVDRDSVSPLGLVWDTYIASHEGRKAVAPYTRNLFGDGSGGDSQTDLGRESTAAAPSNPRKLNRKIEGRWIKANKILRGFFRFPLTDDVEEDSNREKKRKWRILHAAAASGCHYTLFQIACVLHPEQALEFDEEDLYGALEGTNKSAAAPSFTATASLAASVDETFSPVRKTTALHFAASSPKQGHGEIKTLLKLNNDAASFREEGGSEALPLHRIAENEHKTHWIHDGVKDIYQGYPEGIHTQDGRGRTPLHCAASVVSSRLVARGDSGPSSPVATSSPRPAASAAAETGSVVQALVSMYAQAAKTPDNAGRLPLHFVAEHGEGWNKDAEAILGAFPEAVRHRAGPTLQRRLPLHLAATGQDAKISLIQALVTAHPRGAAAGDSDGRLPLHLACESGKTWESGFGVIYEAYPPALHEREGGSDGRGWTPLHILCDSPNDAVAGPLIRKIVQELSPGAAAIPDRKSRYPLHIACASGKTWDEGSVGVLFQAHPPAAFEVDVNGLIPFHAAALALCSAIEEASKPAAIGGPTEGDSVYVHPPPPPPPTRSLSRGDSGTVGSTPATPVRSIGGNSTRSYEDEGGEEDYDLNDDDIGDRERVTDTAAASELARVDTLYRLLHATPHIL